MSWIQRTHTALLTWPSSSMSSAAAVIVIVKRALMPAGSATSGRRRSRRPAAQPHPRPTAIAARAGDSGRAVRRSPCRTHSRGW
ncbi:hypothetical protein WR25_15377 [Diploscapter pachys]|uniref:Uncharacterized protein n=1 Tax=Diploscapter pachys TaxID=2018661 RepID=A0A2A2M3W1_9BILA|nr:hypothetical protein WR25_15377 [Diploscapter pachys]